MNPGSQVVVEATVPSSGLSVVRCRVGWVPQSTRWSTGALGRTRDFDPRDLLGEKNELVDIH